ncbi:MAG: DUF1501 domain-containing protein [Planctomycetales bacterium]|nr:DUF1501 domain-containing protein [Planctomycetales bacterium]
MSLGSVALTWLLNQDGLLGATEKPDFVPPTYTLDPKPPHKPAQANAMISLWMQGGPSHHDLFDPKPELQKRNGETYPGEIKYDSVARASSQMLASRWKFRPHGESGIETSDLLPHLRTVIDDICLIRSMQTGVNNHGQSIQAMNTGQILGGRPVLGSWLTYGLGSETQELPAYVALIDPGQLPVMGVENWNNGYLPAMYQGTVVRPQEPRVLNLTPPARLKGEAQARYLQYLENLNYEHLQRRPGELDLEARIASYKLAANMQTAAKEALDLSQETAATKRMYGFDNPACREFAERCLIARRLVERGVRCVQVFTENQRWDHHLNIASLLPTACMKVDQPSAALVADLKQRGLLDTTLVQWGGEMGRLPVIESDAGVEKAGRDHNTYGFSMWLAGGGVRGGMTYGNTDEFGHKAIENVVNHYDYHATLLHLFGLDPERLTFKQNNRERSLLEGKGRVVHDILVS